ncbi:MAG: NADH:ubiquinone reductase (Na(+)-transporting) subunit B [Fibrobacteria bacterium]|nr:NADH:ubiquinone reductase (Na(+)-transporting) subunit B [Fibrobacteria bacterium]
MSIHKFLDDLEEKSKKGGPLYRFRPLIEAGDTLFRSPNNRTTQGPHIRDNVSLKRMMTIVVLSLFPCVFFGIYNTGLQKCTALGITPDFALCMWEGLVVFLPLLIVSYAVGGFWEVLFSIIREHDINEGFFVTGLLIPLILPPTTPLWQVAIGVSFGVVLGKEVFGGTGMNIVNPALTTRAFLFFAYPAQMSGDKVWVNVDMVKDKLIDGFTGATPLGVAYGGKAEGVVEVLTNAGITLKSLIIGTVSGSFGETSVIACLLGAAVLLITGVASWRIMVSMVVGGALMAMLVQAFAGPESSGLMGLPFYYHLAMGGFAFGAVFMITDPVSAAGTNVGKYIYGFLAGALAIIIRALNPAYPEGVMLAILFMNIFAPLIDYYVVQSNIKRRLKRAQ